MNRIKQIMISSMPVRRRGPLSYRTEANSGSDSRLADQTAALEAKVSAKSSSPIPTSPSNDVPGSSSQEEIAQVKSDLAEALRATGQLQRRLKATEETLEGLKARVKADSTLIRDISAERAQLILKVRDRDEELRGKAQLLVVIFPTQFQFQFSSNTYTIYSKSKMKICLLIYSLTWPNNKRLA